MALSDWDTMMFDWEGDPCGQVEHKGYTFSIYKNWINVDKPNDDSQHVNFQHGEVNLHGVSLTVIRNKRQNSVFILGSKWDDNSKHNKYFLGVGCYGHIGDEEWLKLNHPKEYRKHKKAIEAADMITSWSQFGGGEPDKWGICLWIGRETQEIDLSHIPKPSISDTWVGVGKELSEELFNWAKGLLGEDAVSLAWLEKCKTNQLRFNQGDAFFADNLNIELAATKPGESEAPIISAMLGQGKKKDD